MEQGRVKWDRGRVKWAGKELEGDMRRGEMGKDEAGQE